MGVPSAPLALHEHALRALTIRPPRSLRAQVYDFSVPTFGKGVVYDVEQKVRTEQFRFFTEALKKERLKKYVPLFVMEAEVSSLAMHASEEGGRDGCSSKHVRMPCVRIEIDLHGCVTSALPPVLLTELLQGLPRDRRDRFCQDLWRSDHPHGRQDAARWEVQSALPFRSLHPRGPDLTPGPPPACLPLTQVVRSASRCLRRWPRCCTTWMRA